MLLKINHLKQILGTNNLKKIYLKTMQNSKVKTATFVGYAGHNEPTNPDGTQIQAGDAVYSLSSGEKADGHYLLRIGCKTPLGDNPVLPQE